MLKSLAADEPSDGVQSLGLPVVCALPGTVEIFRTISGKLPHGRYYVPGGEADVHANSARIDAKPNRWPSPSSMAKRSQEAKRFLQWRLNGENSWELKKLPIVHYGG